jgi:hypothetical protein
MPKCYSIKGYCHLYRSMLRFLPIDPFEAENLVFRLNIANIDTCLAKYPDREFKELNSSGFVNRLKQSAVKPYFTEVQLYKSIEALLGNIHWEDITEVQRNAVSRMISLMHTLSCRFEMIHGCEIDDPKTVYAHCRFHLIPDDDEPTTCMLDDNNLIILFRPIPILSKQIRNHLWNRPA